MQEKAPCAYDSGEAHRAAIITMHDGKFSGRAHRRLSRQKIERRVSGAVDSFTLMHTMAGEPPAVLMMLSAKICGHDGLMAMHQADHYAD